MSKFDIIAFTAGKDDGSNQRKQIMPQTSMNAVIGLNEAMDQINKSFEEMTGKDIKGHVPDFATKHDLTSLASKDYADQNEADAKSYANTLTNNLFNNQFQPPEPGPNMPNQEWTQFKSKIIGNDACNVYFYEASLQIYKSQLDAEWGSNAKILFYLPKNVNVTSMSLNGRARLGGIATSDFLSLRTFNADGKNLIMIDGVLDGNDYRSLPDIINIELHGYVI